MSAYESGLTYEQLQDAIASNAAKSIESAKGSLRNNRGMCQIVLSYQKADPSAKTGKKQVRLTHQTDVPYRKNMSDKRKRDIIGEWKSLVLSDIDKASGVRVDPTNTVRALCEQYIAKQQDVGTYTKVKEQGRKTAGISRTTATKRRLDVARLEGFAVYDMPLASVTREMLEKLVADLCKKYSGESVRATFAVVSQVFKWALGEKSDNPCKKLPLPSIDYHPEGSRLEGSKPRHKNILSREDSKAFMQTVEESLGTRREVMMLGAMLALTAGLRTEETCGLMWKDIHLEEDKPYLRVERAVARYRDEDGKWCHAVGLCKTPDSVRRVPLFPETVSILRRVRESRVEALKALKPEDNGGVTILDLYVLGDIRGGFRRSQAQSDSFSKYTHRVNVTGANGTPISMHNLRDSFASRLVNEGIPDTRVQKLLGHTNVQMTQNRYVTSADDDLDEVIEQTQGLFSITEQPKQPDATVYTLSPEEREIIEAYRNAEQLGKRLILSTAREVAEDMEEGAREQRGKMKVV